MKTLQLFTIVTICLVMVGCATTLTNKANLAEEPDGVRIFPPKTYLFVNTKDNKTDIYLLPDYANAYDIKPLTIVAKQDFRVTVNDTGGLSEFATNQDTTAFVDLFKAAADVAKSASAGGAGALTQNTINGTFGLEDGIYVLSEKGFPVKIK